jgi:NAD(P)-dependent dehydrogenase (short-subunit alcohol dehydrogenase family)
MAGRLEGKVAIITGAGRGIGFAAAELFIKEGAKVAVVDMLEDRAREAADKLKAEGGEVIGIAANVADLEQVTRMVKEVVDNFGKVDILVNNAGVGDRGKTFLETTQEDQERVLGTCLLGTINCNRAVLPYMMERNSGSIISIISDAGRVGEPRMTLYSAAKAGIVGHSKALAKEAGPKGIRVNCVSPGATETEQTLETRQKRDEKLGKEKAEEHMRKALKVYPLRRFGQPEDIAQAVLFFASDESSFITGQVLSVSGGYSMVD